MPRLQRLGLCACSTLSCQYGYQRASRQRFQHRSEMLWWRGIMLSLAQQMCTPFAAVQAGLGSAQLKEVGYCAIWAHEYLTDQVAWDSLSPILQTEIRGHLGVATAVTADWARTRALQYAVPGEVSVRDNSPLGHLFSSRPSLSLLHWWE